MARIMMLREVAQVSLVCCKSHQGPPSHRWHFSEAAASLATKAISNRRCSFSSGGPTCNLFLGKDFEGRGLGIWTLNSCREKTVRRNLHGTVVCSGVAEQPDKSRGGLPRFHVDSLPALEGMVSRVEGDEFSHMTKVLRLKVNDRVELFDGRGGIVSGQLLSISRTAAEVVTVENLFQLSPVGPHWHVAAAFCTLKGGRGEWLVEKCTAAKYGFASSGVALVRDISTDGVIAGAVDDELGARTLTPLLTQRSSLVSGGRTDRWQRIALAATKQCQRLHSLDIEEPTLLESFLPQVSRAQVAFVATAGASPLFEIISKAPSSCQSGILFIGPEGDFTPDEVNSLDSMGVTPVGLGPRRLRVETATVAMLAAVMLMFESKETYQTQ